MLNKFYIVFGSLAIGMYGLATLRGWEMVNYKSETAQQSASRHLTGGHRSHWISGFRGGK